MKKIFTLLFFIVSLNLFSQGEANFWFFGQNAGLDFNTDTPTAITGSLYTNEGCASFSDKNGNLLFYTDGIRVWDKDHNEMPNGNNLLGNPSSTQSAIIVPHPGISSQYYIFTVGSNFQGSAGLNSYIVDMTANGGLGDVTDGPTNLSDGKDLEWTEKITSVKGSECHNFWVISVVNDTYYSYRIDINGLNTTPVISFVDYTSIDDRGYLKVSPNGKKLANATFNYWYDDNQVGHFGNGKLHLYSFNDTTGTISNDGIELISNTPFDGEPYGVEFSPNSTKLYCSTHDGINNKLYQFDLENANIIASKTLIKSQFGYRGGLQLAPNGKIYATVPPSYSIGTRYLDAINLPDARGIDCNYEMDAIDLGNTRAMQGLPPFIASILLPIEILDNVTSQNINKTTVKRCIGEEYLLTSENISGTPVYFWTFNNAIVSTDKTLKIDSLSNASAGTYHLEVLTVDDCGFNILYKGEVTVEVYDPPTINKPLNIVQCDDDNDGYFTFDLNNLKDNEVLNGQSNAEFEIVYFTNQTDADTNANPIDGLYTNATPFSNDLIIARIHNIQNPICYKTENFTIQVYESPNPPAEISKLTTCDSENYGTDTDGIEVFDLTSKEVEILNGQSATDFTISYYTDAALVNKIPNPSTFQNNSSNTQTIYLQIVNNFNSSCKSNSFFDIEVYSLPVINYAFTFKQCDEDGSPDGFTDFNLNEVNEYLILGDDSLIVTHHLSFDDANSGINEIDPSPYTNSTQSTVFSRIENPSGCHRVAQIELLVSSTSFPEGYLKTITLCDDDDSLDGLHLFDLAQYSNEIINLFPSGQNLAVTYYRDLNDSQLEENEIPTNQPYLSETAFNQPIYVRVESIDNGECFGLGPYLNLVVDPRPEFDLDATVIYCQNLPPITVTVYNPLGNYTYEWKDENGVVISTEPDATISKGGIYSVIATSNDGCESFPHTINVEPSVIASISQNNFTIIDDSINNSITIATSNLGIGDYEFALDLLNEFLDFQDEPYFNNVVPGIHTVFVRDKNNCGIAQIDVSVIGYPKYFTPNNDGVNDTWKVLGVNENFYTSSQIFIFDRYGKLITQIDPRGDGWDGLLNGKYLPSTDYWFSIELIDNEGNTKIRKGHFSLIRR